MKLLELRDLYRGQVLLDLLPGAREEGFFLLFFLFLGQARIGVDRLHLLFPCNENGLDLSLLGGVKAELGRQEGNLLIGAHPMVMLLIGIRRLRGRRGVR